MVRDPDMVCLFLLHQISLDGFRLIYVSVNQAEVIFSKGTFLKKTAQLLQPCQTLSGSEDPAGVPVQPVADRGPEGL